MSIVNTLALESNRQIKINFYGGDFSSDTGLLLLKEFLSKLDFEQMDEKPEDYSQEDDAGLDLIDFYVLPHYSCV